MARCQLECVSLPLMSGRAHWVDLRVRPLTHMPEAPETQGVGASNHRQALLAKRDLIRLKQGQQPWGEDVSLSSSFPLFYRNSGEPAVGDQTQTHNSHSSLRRADHNSGLWVTNWGCWGEQKFSLKARWKLWFRLSETCHYNWNCQYINGSLWIHFAFKIPFLMMEGENFRLANEK